ncbi:MAG TPA: hypothetical protein VJV79_11950 [Polyangiaceae bacterium]|nr:hypothetical protein [Polyangiaceae bacterium]
MAITHDRRQAAIGGAIMPSFDWQVGDPLKLLGATTSKYDLVASILPMGMKSKSPLTILSTTGAAIELQADVAGLVIALAAGCMSTAGVALFTVAPSFFSSTESLFHRFEDLGLGLQAALALPAGTFAPATHIASYLVVISKTREVRTFVAQLSPDETVNSRIVDNFLGERDGGKLDLGRFVESASFSSIQSIRTKERLEACAGHFGFPAVRLKELSNAINLGRPNADFVFEQHDNALFIPLIGGSDVLDAMSERTLKDQNYAQVVINESVSDAQFVSRFLNSEVGKDLREQSKTGGVIPKLNKQTLAELPIFVPGLAVQREVVSLEGRIAAERNTLLGLQNDIRSLSRELWTNLRPSTAVEQRLTKLSSRLGGAVKAQADEGLLDWVETLPFPLASILREWNTAPTQDFKARYEHLLNFFEAAAQFAAVLLLSAFSSNEAIYEVHRQKLNGSRLDRPAFGTWVTIVEYLGKQTSQMLTEGGNRSGSLTTGDRSACAELFCDESFALPEVLSKQELANIFSTTKKMRNEWKGHGGAVGPDEAKRRNELLLTQLNELREVFAGIWSQMELVLPRGSRQRRNSFEHDVAILTGSRSGFEKPVRPMSIGLDVGHLYLARLQSTRALKLLPFIQLGIQLGATKPSAQNACYFYNHLDGERVRYISYHYTDGSEVTGSFDAATEAIELLKGGRRGRASPPKGMA